MNRNHYDVLIRPIITEEALVAREPKTLKNGKVTPAKYYFEVARNANKIEIAAAFKAIYKCDVTDVNTTTHRGKLRRVRFHQGRTSSWKKAIITIASNQTANIS